MAQVAMLPVMASAPLPGQTTRYFCSGAQGCVVERGEMREVYLGGMLLGRWRHGDTSTRNMLLVTLSQDKRIRQCQLAAAFGIGEERARRIRRRYEKGGVKALAGDNKGGLPRKRTAKLEAELEALFDTGFTIEAATQRIKGQASQTLVGRVHRDYVLRKQAEAKAKQAGEDLVGEKASQTPVPVVTALELSLPASVANDVTREESSTLGASAEAVETSVDAGRPNGEQEASAPSLPENDASNASAEGSVVASVSHEPQADSTGELVPKLAATRQESSARLGGEATSSTPERARREGSLEAAMQRGGQQVQHLGVWLMLAMLNHWGVYQVLERLRAELLSEASSRGGRVGAVALRVVVDAVLAALCIEQKCVEGVRRIATASVPTLLRFTHGISPTWARQVLGRFAEKRGELFHLAVAQLLLRQTDPEGHAPGRAVFYVDNHLRPYTGKQTLRRGWRMQAKRVQPGSSDYYVHDEDGRPVMRFECPDHASMTKMLLPVGRALRDLLGHDGTRIVLVFDRAGAFAEQLAQLRNAGFELVTYERAPYQQLPATSFEHEFALAGERIAYAELGQKNLRRGRGRVRRICARMADEHQVNVLAISDDAPEEVIWLLTKRWARQENQFKHAVERWGVNHLDGRRVQSYPAGTVIPNPARRRLDRALKISRAEEGRLLRSLSLLEATHPSRAKLMTELQRQRQLQAELLAQRPSVPKHAPLEDTELADKLVHHAPRYKLVVDTLRTLLANAESELAVELGSHLSRPAEAKKTLANLIVAPGTVRLSKNRVTITLQPAATPRELHAFDQLAAHLNHLPLSLPGDPSQRRLHVRVHHH